jgi:hypothetical protein
MNPEELSNQIRSADPLAARLYLTYFRYVLEDLIKVNHWDERQQVLIDKWVRDGKPGPMPSLDATIKDIFSRPENKKMREALLALNRAGNTGSHLNLFEDWRNRNDEKVFGRFQPISRVRNAITACRILGQTVPRGIEALFRAVAPDVIATVEREAVDRASLASGDNGDLHSFEPDGSDADGDVGPITFALREQISNTAGWNASAKEAASVAVKEYTGVSVDDIMNIFDSMDHLRTVFNSQSAAPSPPPSLASSAHGGASMPDAHLLTEEARDEAIRSLIRAIGKFQYC